MKGREYSNSLHFNIANGFRSEVGRDVRYWPKADTHNFFVNFENRWTYVQLDLGSNNRNVS